MPNLERDRPKLEPPAVAVFSRHVRPPQRAVPRPGGAGKPQVSRGFLYWKKIYDSASSVRFYKYSAVDKSLIYNHGASHLHLQNNVVSDSKLQFFAIVCRLSELHRNQVETAYLL